MTTTPADAGAGLTDGMIEAARQLGPIGGGTAGLYKNDDDYILATSAYVASSAWTTPLGAWKTAAKNQVDAFQYQTDYDNRTTDSYADYNTYEMADGFGAE